ASPAGSRSSCRSSSRQGSSCSSASAAETLRIDADSAVKAEPDPAPSVSVVVQLFAQRGDETIGEVAPESRFEAVEGRFLRRRPMLSERSHVREYPPRGRRSNLHEYGGTHGAGIGYGAASHDPWRE